jgi:hypothetical protein
MSPLLVLTRIIRQYLCELLKVFSSIGSTTNSATSDISALTKSYEIIALTSFPPVTEKPSPDSLRKAGKNLRVKAERSGANAQRSEPKGSLDA